MYDLETTQQQNSLHKKEQILVVFTRYYPRDLWSSFCFWPISTSDVTYLLPTHLPFKKEDLEGVHGGFINSDEDGAIHDTLYHLTGFDKIFCFELSGIASFQIMMRAQQLSLPLHIIAHENQPELYEKTKFLDKAQNEVAYYATKIHTYSLKTQRKINLYFSFIIHTDKVIYYPFLTGESYNTKRRKRMRSYLKLKEEILWIMPINAPKNWQEHVFIALKIMLLSIPSFKKQFRLIAYSNNQQPEVVRSVYQKNISQIVLFLFQDIKPFAMDLFSSADGWIDMSDETCSINYEGFFAAKTGLSSLIHERSIFTGISQTFISIYDDDPKTIAQYLMALLKPVKKKRV